MAKNTDDWKTAGATGEHAPAWVAFSDAVLTLMRLREDGYAVIHQATRAIEHWFDTEEFPNG